MTADPESDARQLEMLWTGPAAPTPRVAEGYRLRSHRPGDEARFFRLLAAAGWPAWDQATLAPWRRRLFPIGWQMIVTAEGDGLVASAMALRSLAYPGGGEIGWVAADPHHAGRGLGRAATAAVVGRLLDHHARPIHLFTESFRLPALHVYLGLGFAPLLNRDGAARQWEAVCARLDVPFTPSIWPTATS